MKIYLLLASVAAASNAASVALVGIYSALDQAKRNRKLYARRYARKAVPNGDCTSEYRNIVERLEIYEVALNRTYFSENLTFNML